MSGRATVGLGPLAGARDGTGYRQTPIGNSTRAAARTGRCSTSCHARRRSLRPRNAVRSRDTRVLIFPSDVAFSNASERECGCGPGAAPRETEIRPRDSDLRPRPLSSPREATYPRHCPKQRQRAGRPPPDALRTQSIELSLPLSTIAPIAFAAASFLLTVLPLASAHASNGATQSPTSSIPHSLIPAPPLSAT